MTELESICEQALYRELQSFEDGRSLVMDLSSDQIYYKKVLSVYSIPVFSWIKEHTHPNIPRISAFWQQDDKLVVIEEQINGKTLEQLLEEGRLPFEEKKRILLAVCDALSFLHGAQPPIIHRDLKASNIMVTNDGAVKLIDYDAAKIFIKDAKRDTVLIGTQGVAAPEQYGFGASDARTDIYALGKLIERMFPDDAAAAGIVDKATRMEPADRYANVAQVKTKIARLKENDGSAGSSGGGNKKKLLLLAAAALAVFLAAFLLLRSCGEGAPESDTASLEPAESAMEKKDDPAASTEEKQTKPGTAGLEETSTESVGTESEQPPTGSMESTAGRESQPSSVQTDQPWHAEINLEEGEPMGDIRVMQLSAALSGGPRNGRTRVHFEIDVKSTGEHLSYETEDTFAAGQTATAMFSVSDDGGSGEYEVRAYDDGGELMGSFYGGTEETQAERVN